MTLTILPAHLAALQTAAPAVWAPLLTKAIADNAISKPLDFLSNVLKECARLRALRESMNYDAAGLLRRWPSHFTPQLAAQLGRSPQHVANQQMIAEHAYGGRMGNGPVGSGDGWNLRGAGCLQTTGRTNLQEFADAIGWTGPLEQLAAQMAQPEFAAASAGLFWRARRCDSLPDPTAIRIRINGGTTGLSDVLALRTECARVLGFPTGRPVAIPPLRPVQSPALVRPTISADDLNALSLQRARIAA